MPLSIRPLVCLILIYSVLSNRPFTGFQEAEVCSISMALSRPIQPVTSAYSSSSGSGSNMLLVCTTLSENISFEPLTSAFSGDSRYLTHLKVFEKGEELFQSDPSQSTVTGGMSIFLMSYLSVLRYLSLFQFANIRPLK